MLSKLFKKQKHPSLSWGPTLSKLPEYDISSRTFGSLHLSDSIDTAAFLGKPESANEVRKNYYSLLYSNLGLVAEFEVNKLTYLGFIIAQDSSEPSSNHLQYCSPILTEAGEVKLQLSDSTTVEEVTSHFGSPTSSDDDGEEIILTFVDGLFTMEFEFNHKRLLKRWNTFIN
ncbi:hypothetical protein [Rubritalea sp.]|uniref:hypothetical protein n=1 Tax=Rubritalea sp. TaxID=2109375 RepID=UPI003EF0D132